MNTFHKKINDVPSPLIRSPQVLFRNTIIIDQFHHFHPFFLRNSKNPNHRQVDLTLVHKMKFFGIFKNSSALNYLEFRKFLAITLKGTVNTFHKKINDVPSPLISSPLVLFQKTIKYHKIRTISPFSPIFFLRN